MYAASIISFADSLGFSEFFLCVYTLFYASIIASFELTRAYKLVAVEIVFRRNLGFLYVHWLKACFIIFIAFINLGLSMTSPGLEYSTFGVVLLDGLLLLLASCMKPKWFPTEDLDVDLSAPTASPIAAHEQI